MILPPSLAELNSEVRLGLKSGHMRLSFSQFGEDNCLWHFLSMNNRFKGFYVDVGCHHPYRFSNTAGLHIIHGWSGINIDLDPRAIAEFERARPNDINLCIGIGSEAGVREATIFEEGAINTLAPESTNPAFREIPRRQANVEIRTLGDILHQYLRPGFLIDLLDIDAEGYDMEVLRSNDWDAFRPFCVAVETERFNFHNPMEHESFRFMQMLNYCCVSYVGNTCIYLTN